MIGNIKEIFSVAGQFEFPLLVRKPNLQETLITSHDDPELTSHLELGATSPIC
jgi:hypothetical protein